MEIINEARKEANEQMDVRLIIKKLERLERINQLLLNERDLICAQLIAPPTIEKIKKLRKITQYYDKVIETDEKMSKAQVTPQDDGKKVL